MHAFWAPTLLHFMIVIKNGWKSITLPTIADLEMNGTGNNEEQVVFIIILQKKRFCYWMKLKYLWLENSGTLKMKGNQFTSIDLG